MDDPPKLVMPADIAEKARRSVDRNLKSWLFGGVVTPLTLRLGSPSEAVVAAYRSTVEAWARAWQGSRLDVRWEERKWPSLGRQLLPVSVTLDGAEAIVAAAGLTGRWRTIQQRLARLRAFDDGPRWSEVLSGSFRHWNTLADEDFDRLVAVLHWLEQNPASGLLIRQLPIPGVDTKWLGAHRAGVTSLAVPLGVPEHLGLRERELLRAIAILDPALRQGLPRLLAAPDRELAAFPWHRYGSSSSKTCKPLRRCPTYPIPSPCSGGATMRWRLPTSLGCVAHNTCSIGATWTLKVSPSCLASARDVPARAC